jgi:hypothetical protein
MKKEEIYVIINSEEKRLRAIQILSDEKIISYSSLLHVGGIGQLTFDIDAWNLPSLKYYLGDKTEITLDQLEQMLNPIKEVGMSLDALKLIAESWGFKLVKEERKIKVGDFGKFSSENGSVCSYGFLYKMTNIESGIIYVENNKDITNHWSKFYHLTDEEKQQIQENW